MIQVRFHLTISITVVELFAVWAVFLSRASLNAVQALRVVVESVRY